MCTEHTENQCNPLMSFLCDTFILLLSHTLFRQDCSRTGGGDVVREKCAVAGGRSRLHLLDLGSCSRSKDGTALSLSALGTVLLALFSGQRHLPYRYCVCS